MKIEQFSKNFSIFLFTIGISLKSYDGILCMEGDRRLGGVFAN